VGRSDVRSVDDSHATAGAQQAVPGRGIVDNPITIMGTCVVALRTEQGGLRPLVVGAVAGGLRERHRRGE